MLRQRHSLRRAEIFRRGGAAGKEQLTLRAISESRRLGVRELCCTGERHRSDGHTLRGSPTHSATVRSFLPLSENIRCVAATPFDSPLPLVRLAFAEALIARERDEGSTCCDRAPGWATREGRGFGEDPSSLLKRPSKVVLSRGRFTNAIPHWGRTLLRYLPMAMAGRRNMESVMLKTMVTMLLGLAAMAGPALAGTSNGAAPAKCE